MSRHLLLVTIGPVQEFIAQARRTRDLWYGSQVLSELSLVAVNSLESAGAELIFPELRGQGTAGVPNRVLAEVPDTLDPLDLARETRRAIASEWRLRGDQVRTRCRALLAPGMDKAWDEQISTFLEFTAAWAPFDERSYRDTRHKVESAIGRRKNLRDFDQWTELRGNVPKSSLDGARETVLAEPKKRNPSLVKRYRIATGEQLDAVGLVKRAGGEPEQFIPIVNVALAPWFAFAAENAPAAFEKARRASEAINLSKVHRPDLPAAVAFPYDGSVFMPGRWKSLFDEQHRSDKSQIWGTENIGSLLAKIREPYPYVACLVADGDGIGAALDGLATPKDHQNFSCVLLSFALEARRIVEQDHLGSLVYAGGDDVLAFLPLTRVLSCAQALRTCFSSTITEQLPAAKFVLTLSVGIGIGHVMESMGDLLDLGRQAERTAKLAGWGSASRNALAITVDKRSGGRRTWRSRWDAWGGDPVGRLQSDIELLGTRLSMRKIHEIGRTLSRLPPAQAPLGADSDGWKRVVNLEVKRSLLRTQGGEVGLEPLEVGLNLDQSDYRTSYEHAKAWVDRMLIARTLAEAEPRVRV